MKTIKFTLTLSCLMLLSMVSCGKEKALRVIDTKETIMKVRDGKENGKKFITCSTYDGDIMRVDYDGKVKWKKELEHGIMNHDIWCGDITGDSIDEILVASANGSIYCLSSDGEIMWHYQGGETPMYAVCTLRKDGVPYIICSNFDTNFYYLNAKGERVKTIDTSKFSIEKSSAQFTAIPKSNVCVANFIRPIRKADGTEAVVVLGSNSHMNVKGTLYFFDVLEDMPYNTKKIVAGDEAGRVLGSFSLIDLDNNGVDEIILGSSANTNKSGMIIYSQETNETKSYGNPVGFKNGGGNGYTVTFAFEIGEKDKKELLAVTSTHTYIVNKKLDFKNSEMIYLKYTFNDYWKDNSGNILIASEQSGGSCIYILDTNNPKWKTEYTNLKPIGKYQKVLDNTNKANKLLAKFEKPSYEIELRDIFFMDNSKTTDLTKETVEYIEKNLKNPQYLGNAGSKYVQDPKDWRRDTMSNAKARDKRDRRHSYTKTEQQILDNIFPNINNKGVAMWGGHGNDPYFYSPQTLRKIIDYADGRQSIFIYPELHGVGEDVVYTVNNLFYPLAEYGKDKNLKIYLRTKNVFWQGHVHDKLWGRLLSGEFSNVFVSSMEETTDKSMDVSLAGRVGVWASGSIDDWGTRAIMDNVSFDRSRQFGVQSMPNHFLRSLVYHISLGATYLNNASVGADYMNILNNLIAKGLLFCPKSEEILSLSPVHLSMHNPDPMFLEFAANNKWTTFYDKKYEEENPYVIGRLNGSWLGAKVNEWDFSSYASGVKDRRLNFLPPNANGLVLFTPVQNGVLADKDAPRGKLVDHLHPIYRDIMKEYVTDGKNYFSADGKETYSPKTYYKEVEKEIKERAKLIPINVSGDNVAWVVAQSASKHLRLTLIDGGYLNPDDRVANVMFNGVKVIKITDLLTGETFKERDGKAIIDIPCGLFRFIDVEIENEETVI